MLQHTGMRPVQCRCGGFKFGAEVCHAFNANIAARAAQFMGQGVHLCRILASDRIIEFGQELRRGGLKQGQQLVNGLGIIAKVITLMATSNSPTFGQSNSPRQDG